MSLLPLLVLFILFGVGSLCVFMAMDHADQTKKYWNSRRASASTVGFQQPEGKIVNEMSR